MSSPAAARMNPIRIDTSDLSGLPPPSPMKEENVRSWMAKNSGGPNRSATSARMGAKSVMRMTENRAPTNDEVKAAVRAGPPSPRLAMGNPSNVVATDHGSPGMLNRIDVIAPPKSAPQYMHESMMIAEVGDMLNVSGSRMATPLAPPSPGSTPTMTPSTMPTTISIKLNGCTTTAKP